MDSDPEPRVERAPDAAPTGLDRVREAAARNALWIQVAIGVIAWIALMLAYPLQSTTPIYAGF